MGDSRVLLSVVVDLLAIVLMVVVMLSGNRYEPDPRKSKFVGHAFRAALGVACMDLVGRLLNDRPFFIPLNAVSNIIYFLLLLVITKEWVEYAGTWSLSRPFRPWFWWAVVEIPFLVAFFIVLLSPFTGWIFWFDEAGAYRRGPYATPLGVLMGAYALLASVGMVGRSRRDLSASRRHDAKVFAGFSLFPVIGGVLQMLSVKVACVPICFAYGLLVVYLNFEGRTATHDGLTGLWNRGYFDQYLNQHFNELHLALFLLDCNDFKDINNAYGHEAGDRALIRIANALEDVFNDEPGMVARYGGDEFVVVWSGFEELNLREWAEKIRKAVADIPADPVRLSVSVGYARASEIQGDGEALVKLADRRMYAEKRVWHGEDPVSRP